MVDCGEMESSYDGIGSGLGYAPLVTIALLVALVAAYGFLSKPARRAAVGWMKPVGGLLILATILIIAIDALRLFAR